MGRKKRSSRILEQATARLNGLKSINSTLDFGNGLSVTALEQAINSLRTKLDGYNQKLSEIDDDLNSLEEDERELKEINGRFLAGTGAMYGKNSSQYEVVGGVRTSDRKRPSRKGGSGSSSKE
jgi:uncharacterized phage infection (PIP) family protein YhgE